MLLNKKNVLRFLYSLILLSLILSCKNGIINNQNEIPIPIPIPIVSSDDSAIVPEKSYI